MPQMSSTDAKFHSAKELIYALQNPAPSSPIIKLGNLHKEALRTLAEIFIKTTPPLVPPSGRQGMKEGGGGGRCGGANRQRKNNFGPP